MSKKPVKISNEAIAVSKVVKKETGINMDAQFEKAHRKEYKAFYTKKNQKINL